MASVFSKLDLAGLATALVKLGVNITGKQYEYLKWRLSDEGKKHFTQEQDNKFYEALEKGDTDVMDLEIRERQKEIDGLLGELGPLCILIGLLLLTGCSTMTIPEDRPMAHPGSLLANEKSYVVKDMKVKTPQGNKEVLKGTWHVVSPEFIKVHRTNQDNLLKSLKALKRERKATTWWRVTVGVALAAGFVMGYKLRGGKV
jgi:hypothetical protein